MTKVAEPALKKLRNRLLFINMISLTLVIAASFSIIYINLYNRTQGEIARQLESIPRGVMENAMLSSRDVISIASVDDAEGMSISFTGEALPPVDYSKAFVANIENDGRIAVFSMLSFDVAVYVDAIKDALETGKKTGDVNIAGHTWRFSLEQNPVSSASYKYSIVFLDIEDANASLSALLVRFLISGIIAIMVVLLISLRFANRAIRPVEESMVRQRRFIADASHELKTPIAVISANAEAASGAVRESESSEISQWIENISNETSRMNELIENLLTLAKTGEKHADNAPFDLIDAIREEADRVEAFLFEKGISFDSDFQGTQDGQLFVHSDRTKVQAILSVLLENAVKYTPEKGRVLITLGRENGSSVFFSVSNTGRFIPPEDIEHLFDRFYRADPSRNSETGGHGIGLSIAREIAGTLNGELKAESIQNDDGKATNTFTFSFSA